VLGWIALGVSVFGAIVACIPFVIGLGWALLAAGFIMSIIALVMKGAKWPGIVGLAVSVVGSIASVVILVVIGIGVAMNELQTVADPTPSSHVTTEDPVDESDAAGRPTAAELSVGLTAIIEATGVDGYTPEILACVSEQLVGSELSDDTLQSIAAGDDPAVDAEGEDITTVFGEAIANCLPQ
jgi:hypothetical protein